MRGLVTDHVISGPMRGFKKCIQWRTRTNRYGDTMTQSTQWGQFSEKVDYQKKQKDQKVARKLAERFWKLVRKLSESCQNIIRNSQ